MLGTISIFLIASTLWGQTAILANPTSKISELRLYSTYDSQELLKAEGMMSEIVITAERPLITESNNVKSKQKLPDYLTIISNVLIIVFFIGVGLDKILSKWKKRKNIKKEKGPFSLPPFSNKNIKIGKNCTYQSVA